MKRGGCRSSYLFEDFKYATTKSAIEKGRLVFFIAKNPNLKDHKDYDYYFVGLLYMKSGLDKRAWGERLYYFEATKKKSIRFPSSGNKVIRLDKDLEKKLGSLRGNPKYISREDAISILREYFEKTRDRKAKEILEKDLGIRV